jgi:hypothetical protein
MSITEQVRGESEKVARNIATYLEQNTPERSQGTQMQMYDEQFEKQQEADDAAAGSRVDQFRAAFAK